jgi:hypothetical protein
MLANRDIIGRLSSSICSALSSSNRQVLWPQLPRRGVSVSLWSTRPGECRRRRGTCRKSPRGWPYRSEIMIVSTSVKKPGEVTRKSGLTLPTTPLTASGTSVKASSKPKNWAALLPSSVLTALQIRSARCTKLYKGEALPRMEGDSDELGVLDVDATEDEVECGLGSTVRADVPGDVLGSGDGGNTGGDDGELGLLGGLEQGKDGLE